MSSYWFQIINPEHAFDSKIQMEVILENMRDEDMLLVEKKNEFQNNRTYIVFCPQNITSILHLQQ